MEPRKRFESLDILDSHLSNSRKIYVFRCGTALYALTFDSTGGNLPPGACCTGWQFEQSITFRLDNRSPKHDLAKATLAAIAKHGFYITHAAIPALPVEIVGSRYDDKTNDSDCGARSDSLGSED
jgi:hypothetical protein